jgi:hypothetical protein
VAWAWGSTREPIGHGPALAAGPQVAQRARAREWNGPRASFSWPCQMKKEKCPKFIIFSEAILMDAAMFKCLSLLKFEPT